MPASTHSDALLVESIRRGKPDAWSDLISQYEGRRPAIPLSSADGTGGNWEPAGAGRPASSIARSGERRQLEDEALAEAIAKQLDGWRAAGDWDKVKCMELLFVVGATNKATAEHVGLTEQQVANFKFDFLERLRKFVKQQRLSEDVFPELHE